MPNPKKKKFHLSLGHIIRLGMFIALVYFAINYLSSNRLAPSGPDPTVLGTETQQLNLAPMVTQAYLLIPSPSRAKLESLPSSPAIITWQQRINNFVADNKDFPQKQIKEVQKWLVRRVSDDLIKKIDKSN